MFSVFIVFMFNMFTVVMFNVVIVFMFNMFTVVMFNVFSLCSCLMYSL